MNPVPYPPEGDDWIDDQQGVHLDRKDKTLLGIAIAAMATLLLLVMIGIGF